MLWKVSFERKIKAFIKSSRKRGRKNRNEDLQLLNEHDYICHACYYKAQYVPFNKKEAAPTITLLISRAARKKCVFGCVTKERF